MSNKQKKRKNPFQEKSKVAQQSVGSKPTTEIKEKTLKAQTLVLKPKKTGEYTLPQQNNQNVN